MKQAQKGTRTASPNTTLKVSNTTPVVVTTELDNRHLILKIGGKLFGTVQDTFCKNQAPPSKMRLQVEYLPNGDRVSGTWRSATSNGVFTDDPTCKMIYADFPIPAVGAPAGQYNFTIVDDAGNERHDPLLIVLQVENC